MSMFHSRPTRVTLDYLLKDCKAFGQRAAPSCLSVRPQRDVVHLPRFDRLPRIREVRKPVLAPAFVSAVMLDTEENSK